MRRSLIALWAVLCAFPAFSAPAFDPLFDATRLHDVRISMAAADWDRLRATYLEDTNYDATLTFDGETIADCTIRSRGSGTRNGIKPGLRVDFSRKVKTQTFHGFKRLVLDNMYNDPSFLREQLAFAVFAEAGIPVPRESFARLTVNGQYWGLYAIVEPIDEIFARNHVDAGGGNLFEYNVPATQPGQLLAWDFSLSRGETIDGYVPSPFEPKTNEDDLDGSALLDLIRTITDAPDSTFAAEISEFVDPRILLTHYAIEVATGEVDGLTSFFGANNFYLYQLEGSRRFVFLPWDHDFNFTSAGHSIYFGAERNRLVQRLLADPEWREFYRSTLRAIVTGYVNAAWMTPRLESMAALIRDSVLEDTKRRPGDFDAAVAHLEAFIAERGASVEAQLQARRRRAARH
jgi:spore coat protein CotH